MVRAGTKAAQRWWQSSAVKLGAAQVSRLIPTTNVLEVTCNDKHTANQGSTHHASHGATGKNIHQSVTMAQRDTYKPGRALCFSLVCSLTLKVCISFQLTRHLPVSYFGPPRAILTFLSNVSSLLPNQVRASHLYVRDATLTSWVRPYLLLQIGLVAFC